MVDAVIVAIEAATEGCSAAVETPAGIVQRFAEAPRQHSVRLLPMLAEAMAEAGVDHQQVGAVAFGQGPGGFVGVRLAASVAQGLCLAWEVPALPISTLAALANGARREYGVQSVVAALDARMGQVYWGSYKLSCGHQLMATEHGDQVADPEQLAASLDNNGIDVAKCFGIGRGFAAYAQYLPQHGLGVDAAALPQARDLLPHARHMLDTAQGVAPQLALPVYLREGV